MPKVTYAKTVSDSHVKAVLQRMADFFGKDISVHSGDRDFVPKGGSKKSLHLAHRAADFHVSGMSDSKAFQSLHENIGQVFDPSQGYELIIHGQYTNTGGPHLHIGHYPQNEKKGLVLFKREGLTPKTRGEYSIEPQEIRAGKPIVVSPPPTVPDTQTPKNQDPKTPVSKTARLTASVGTGGKNLWDDVILVQKLLNRARTGTSQGKAIAKLYEALIEDGLFGPKTRQAIVQFQKDIAGFQLPDGRVDPDGRTFRLLSAWTGDDHPPANKTEPKTQPQVGSVLFRKGERTFDSSNGYPIYAQWKNAAGKVEDKWAALPIGPSTVAGIGCAMTSVTMAISGIGGMTVTPDEMNRFMNKIGGFNGQGGIQKWDRMGELIEPHVAVTRRHGENIDANRIDKELDAGRPVVVQVDYYRGRGKSATAGHDGVGDHWILIAGRTSDKRYMAIDPAGGKLITLHRLMDGRLEGDTADNKHKTKYLTTGQATTFSRGPAVVVAGQQQPVKNTVTPPPLVVVKSPTTSTSTSTSTNKGSSGKGVSGKGSSGKGTKSENALRQAPAAVELAIREASQKVGVNYGYMMAMAAQESGFDPAIKAKTSSATGLYQFLNQTWLGVVKNHGAKHGMNKWVGKISYSTAQKKYVVTPSSSLTDVLDLRKDAKLSALMGAEFAKENQNILSKKLGRGVNPTDLYMAHFLGPGDATKFLAACDSGKGNQSAATMFPKPAEANKTIFYKKGGTARSLHEVYAIMYSKIGPKADAYNLTRKAA